MFCCAILLVGLLICVVEDLFVPFVYNMVNVGLFVCGLCVGMLLFLAYVCLVKGVFFSILWVVAVGVCLLC